MRPYLLVLDVDFLAHTEEEMREKYAEAARVIALCWPDAKIVEYDHASLRLELPDDAMIADHLAEEIGKTLEASVDRLTVKRTC